MNIPILKTRSRLREVKRLVLRSGFEPTYLLALSLLEASILGCSQGRHSIRNMSLYRKKISTGYSFASQPWYAAGRAKQGCGRGRRQDLCSRRVQLWRAERSVRWSGRASRSNQEEGPGTLGWRGLGPGRLRGDSCSGGGCLQPGFSEALASGQKQEGARRDWSALDFRSHCTHSCPFLLKCSLAYSLVA